jgi:hypothetical protein
MRPIVFFSCLGAILYLSTAAVPTGDSAADVRQRLAGMPRPWNEAMHRLTLEEYAAALEYWSKQHPDWVTVEEAGQSAKGLPVYLMSITAKETPVEDKQIALFVSLHGGPERSGTTSILHLAEWLLSDDPLAEETRGKQVILLMPIINPEAFFETDRFGNAHGIDPYTGRGGTWNLETLTFEPLEKAPELAAFLDVVDRYRPEIIADMHGIGLQEFPDDKLGDRTMRSGQTMFEIVGSAYSNYALRPWDWRITETMIAAGLATGAGADRFEADAQRGFWGPAMNPINGRVWLGRPNFYSAQYAYAKYHTMTVTCEVGYEQCTLARLQALLKIGNDVWESENRPGYPVDRVKGFTGHFVTAWGRTARERRDSRIALWQGQARFSQAILYPQFDGRDTYICATTPEAAQVLTKDRDAFLEKIAAIPGVDGAAVRAFAEEGPEIMLAVDAAAAGESPEENPLRHGIGFRLRLPYPNPKLLDIRLNGHLLDEDPEDGYQSWSGNGYTHVQIHVPPEKAVQSELFIVTCAYKPDIQRTFGWRPPEAVLRKVHEVKP